MKITFYWAALATVWAIALMTTDAARGQNVPPRALEEIARRGDRVETVHFAGDEDLAPPGDDSHKWFISVVASQNCGACVRLQNDFRTDPQLRKFATEWSHYNVFYAEDSTQSWRWRNVKIAVFPTILIQPPRDRSFGDPATVAVQINGYSGRPETLARKIRAGVRKYVEATREPQRRLPFSPAPEPAPEPTPPFDLSPPPVEPIAVPPEVVPDSDTGLPDVGGLIWDALRGLLSGDGLNYALLAVIALLLIRQYRQSQGQAPILDQRQFRAIVDFLLDAKREVKRLDDLRDEKKD